MKTQSLALHDRRKLRRMISCAMAGAALGTGFLAIPKVANAAIYTVTTTSDTHVDGQLTLREAIEAANTDNDNSSIIFSSSLGTNPAFTLNSALPDVTQPVVFGTSNVGSLNLPQTLAANGGQLVLSASHITGNASATNANFYLDEYLGESSSITGNAVANDGGKFLVDASSYITGDATANNGQFWLYGSGNYIGGNATANGSGQIMLGSDSYIGGDAFANDSSLIELDGDSHINGNATANGGSFLLTGNSYISGDATANNGGSFDLASDNYIGGDVTSNDSTFNLYSSSHIDGNVTADDSLFVLNSANNIAGNVIANNSTFSLYGTSSITGNVTANDSEFTLYGFSHIDNDISATNGGYFDIEGGAYIDGNASADGINRHGHTSEIDLINGARINGDISATNGGYFDIVDGSSVGGNATADGKGPNGYFSEIDLYNGNTIEGSISATNGGWFGLENDGETNVVNGNATFSGSSNLWNEGNNTLNAGGGSTATTFDESSSFSPYLTIHSYDNGYDFSNPITSDVLTVNNLTLNNSKLEPWWYPEDGINRIPVGQTYDVLHYDGTLSGTFNPTVVSPLTFDVVYSSGYDGDVLLSVTGVDFTHVGGTSNERSLEKYLNHFYTIESGGQGGDAITFDPDSKLPFDLAELTAEMGQYDSHVMDYLIHDEYSAHNTQTYWNQQAFVNSIADNLRNDSNMPGGASSFALNQTNSGGTQMQLASLRQAMTSIPGGLGISKNAGGASSGVWAAYTGSHQSTDADSGTGSNEWSSSSDGYTVGYTNGGDNFRWGVAAGHQKSTFTMADSNNEVKGWNAGLYAAWQRKNIYLNGVLGYGNYDNSVYNETETDFKTHGLSAYLELGKRLKEESKGGLSPYASVLWTRVKNGSASDEDNGFNLESSSSNVYTTALGMRYNRRMLDANGALKGGWQAGLAWLHQFGDTNFPVNGNFSATDPYNFQIENSGLSGNAAQVQLGAYGRIHRNLIGFANYVGTFGSKQNINGVSAGVGYQF